MSRRPFRLGLATTLLVAAAASPIPRQREEAAPLPAQASPWVERTPYEIPFADRRAWLKFMAEGGADTIGLAGAVSETEFAGLVDGSLATVERVRFLSDSLVLRGILVRPPGDGPFPAAVYARGGNREYGRLLFLDVVRMVGLARAGVVVLAPEYRGENGSEGSPELAGGDVDDLLAAVDALESWPDADTRELGLVGLSRGGLVATWALTRSEAFDAAVLIAPDLDLEDTARRRPAMDSAIFALSLPGYDEDREGALRRASPIHAVEDLAPTPVLLVHGSEDAAVHPSVSQAFSRRLRDAGHLHRLELLPGAGHDLTSHAGEVRRLTREWLERYLPGLDAGASVPP